MAWRLPSIRTRPPTRSGSSRDASAALLDRALLRAPRGGAVPAQVTGHDLVIAFERLPLPVPVRMAAAEAVDEQQRRPPLARAREVHGSRLPARKRVTASSGAPPARARRRPP